MRRWSMGDAAAVAEAEADTSVSVGWLALVVLAGGVLGAYLASSVRHRRGGSSSPTTSSFWGRTTPRPLLAARPVTRQPESRSEEEPAPKESPRAEASSGDRDAALPKPGNKSSGKRVKMVQLRKR